MTVLDLIYQLLKQRYARHPWVRQEALQGLEECARIVRNWP